MVLETEHSFINGNESSTTADIDIYVSGNGNDFTKIDTITSIRKFSNTSFNITNITSEYINAGGKIGIKYYRVNEDTSINSVRLIKCDDFWAYSYDPSSTYQGKIAYSTDGGVNWSTSATSPTTVPGGNMRFKLGWREGDISYRASNQTSIDTYGRHFKKISDSTITTEERAQQRAEYEISGSETIKMKGTVTILGEPNLSTEYMISSNLAKFDIYDRWNISNYTHKIDDKGFTTTINYGAPTFDFIHKIAKLEREMESEVD